VAEAADIFYHFHVFYVSVQGHILKSENCSADSKISQDEIAENGFGGFSGNWAGGAKNPIALPESGFADGSEGWSGRRWGGFCESDGL